MDKVPVMVGDKFFFQCKCGWYTELKYVSIYKETCWLCDRKYLIQHIWGLCLVRYDILRHTSLNGRFIIEEIS